MFKEYTIENFRGIRQLVAGNLRRINLLGGRNTAGKTSVLEAMYVLLGGGGQGHVTVVAFHRGVFQFNVSQQTVEDFLWRQLISGLRREESIRIAGLLDSGERCETTLALGPSTVDIQAAAATGGGALLRTALRVEYSQSGGVKQRSEMFVEESNIRSTVTSFPGPCPSVFLSSNVPVSLQDATERWGTLELEGGTHEVVDALRLLEPRLKSITTISRSGAAVLWATLQDGTKLPAHLLGEGTVRFALLLLFVASARNGVVLVDEVENGIHHAALEGLWSVLADAAVKFNVQVIATTHSWECITAADAACKDVSGGFAYHRLDRRDGVHSWQTYDAGALSAAVDEGIEVR